MINIVDKTKCSGCTACYATCPVGCIEIKMDNEGFYYPFVDVDKCIKCNKCVNVCPINNDFINIRSDKMTLYGCQNTEEKIRLHSTSGGMFSVLAEYVIDQSGVVFGAGYDEHKHVVHKNVETKKDLNELCSSKYVQSELGECFKLIKQLTDIEKLVLFVGTPCQVEGLIYFMGGQNKYLITADLECYGVPSPGLFDKYLLFIENKYISPIKNIYFRDKKYGYYGVNVKIILDNGRVLEDNLDVKSYLKSMFSNLGLRPICYDCPFRVRKKVSDFTLGDFWTIGKYSINMDDELGTTRLKINTPKGEKIFDSIKNKLRYCYIAYIKEDQLDSILMENKLIRHCDFKRRNSFFNAMHTLSYPQLMNEYLPVTFRDKVNNVVKPMINKILPSKISRLIFKKKKIRQISSVN